MGQVVDISIDGQPKQLKQEPNEERAYNEHVRQQMQLDQQRVAQGLEPVTAEPPSGDSELVAADDPAVLTDEDDGPQSIYTEMFAGLGLADFMQSILDENKAERDAEKRTEAQGQPTTNGVAHTHDGPPQINHQTGSEIGVGASAQHPAHALFGVSQNGNGVSPWASVLNNTYDTPIVKPSSMIHSSQGISRFDTSKAATSGPGKAGLSQSRWNTEPVQSGQGANVAAQGGAKPVENQTLPLKQPLKQTLPSGSDWW